MSLDAMKKVADAEAAAKQSLQAATAQAKQLIADAEAQGRRLQAARRSEAEAENLRLMRQAEETGEKKRESILQHAENQCAVLRARAESHLDEASGRIVERIVMG